MPERILVADDQANVRELLESLLSRRGAELISTEDAETALHNLEMNPGGLDLIILDLDFGPGKMHGLQALEEIHKRDPEVPVIILTGKGTVSSAVEAMKLGAQDFVEKNFYIEEQIEQSIARLEQLIRANMTNKRLRREREFYRQELKGKYDIVGEGAAIRVVLEDIERISSIPRPVLIRGERGTGKELAAAAIHQSSNRSKGPFITINCAALAEGLLECELFGQEDNAFTNSSFREGRFTLADKGTLFLDEIGNMSDEFQRKILRVIEYQQFERVGGTKTLSVDVRIIAATNADLETEMKQGRFREDLYDRLAFETIWMPPLREHKEDIERLSYHFMDQLGKEVPGIKPKKLMPETLECMMDYDWPGNVRELKYVIERATYRAEGNTLMPHHLPQDILTACTRDGKESKFREQVGMYERQILVDALERCEWDLQRAATDLGLPPEELEKLCKRHQLQQET